MSLWNSTDIWLYVIMYFFLLNLVFVVICNEFYKCLILKALQFMPNMCPWIQSKNFWLKGMIVKNFSDVQIFNAS